MSQIRTWIKYTKAYLPTPRSRKYRYSNEEEYVQIELEEASFQDLVPAFVVEGDAHIYYLYHERLYMKAEERDVWARSDGKSALDALTCVNAEYSKYFGFSYQDTREKMIAKAKADMSMYLLVNGELYRTIGEPMYHISTFGLYNNHGGTALMVVNDYSDSDPDHYFCALDAELAIAEANRVAAERGDTENIGTFRQRIVVLLPDAVKVPRKIASNDVQEDSSQVTTHEPKLKEIFLCNHCGHELDSAQTELNADDPNRWKFCPICATSIVWEEIAPVIPGDYNCEVCGCWLGTVRPNGSSYASSHYNGTGICDDCMMEHCMATNCLECKIGKYPNCQFQDMKKYYLEETNGENSHSEES